MLPDARPGSLPRPRRGGALSLVGRAHGPGGLALSRRRGGGALPGKRGELLQRMIAQSNIDRFGMLVQFTHPFEAEDDCQSDREASKLLAKIRKWAKNPQKHQAFERTFREALRRHAREELPFPSACLVASGRQQKRMGHPLVRRWRGAALDGLAVLAQSSSRLWMRDKEPQMERVAVTDGDGLLRTVTLLLPAGFSDPRLSEPMESCLP